MAKILTFGTALWETRPLGNGNSTCPQPLDLFPERRSADTDGYRAKDI